MLESTLYPAVKGFLDAAGFQVKARWGDVLRSNRVLRTADRLGQRRPPHGNPGAGVRVWPRPFLAALARSRQHATVAQAAVAGVSSRTAPPGHGT
jgi:hypothetical protein